MNPSVGEFPERQSEEAKTLDMAKMPMLISLTSSQHYLKASCLCYFEVSHQGLSVLCPQAGIFQPTAIRLSVKPIALFFKIFHPLGA